MNKKIYEAPEAEVLDFDEADIVTVSPNAKITPDTDNYEGDIIKFSKP